MKQLTHVTLGAHYKMRSKLHISNEPLFLVKHKTLLSPRDIDNILNLQSNNDERGENTEWIYEVTVSRDSKTHNSPEWFLHCLSTTQVLGWVMQVYFWNTTSTNFTQLHLQHYIKTGDKKNNYLKVMSPSTIKNKNPHKNQCSIMFIIAFRERNSF